MKKTFLIFTAFAFMMLGGCSFLGEANQTLAYVNKATEHINHLSNFADTAPQMIQQAALNANVKSELGNQLNTLKTEIEQFNQINPPAIAKDIHQQIVSKNQVILGEINQVMKNDEVVLDSLESSQIFTTINQVTILLNQLQKLGM